LNCKLSLSIGPVQAENHKTDKKCNHLIWIQFQPNTFSICSGGNRMVRLLRIWLKFCLPINLYYPKIYIFQIIQYLDHNITYDRRTKWKTKRVKPNPHSTECFDILSIIPVSSRIMDSCSALMQTHFLFISRLQF
jgi:hypothetical protein